MTEHRFQQTRIAPTPSGFLHLGNAYSFIFTKKLAADSGAEIRLRIDDNDADRMREPFLQDIFDTLEFLQIQWQSGPANAQQHHQHFSQQLRLPRYNEALQQLIMHPLVYACSCSRSSFASGNSCQCESRQIPRDEPNTALKMKVNPRKIRLRTWEGITDQKLTAAPFTLRKRDGKPSYQLCSVIDDLDFKVDLVVRGEDLLESTLCQLYLAETMGWQKFADTTFVHHPLIKTPDGQKLSKSAGDISVLHWRKTGMTLPDVMQKIRHLTGSFAPFYQVT